MTHPSRRIPQQSAFAQLAVPCLGENDDEGVHQRQAQPSGEQCEWV
eukprot:CAMPEP_0115486066 /NCGR_PEP_ID=MMETSP0271-20121206/60245_1 /TAXON_ID=71861 /ORGANISM="Scrippsiella trochoidea, Strain CCMP3099" /LENGTH=45 /DNA_ID= /DNA_START= /DNA_END= /DNA_ORIENTATION=